MVLGGIRMVNEELHQFWQDDSWQTLYKLFYLVKLEIVIESLMTESQLTLSPNHNKFIISNDHVMI